MPTHCPTPARYPRVVELDKRDPPLGMKRSSGMKNDSVYRVERNDSVYRFERNESRIIAICQYATSRVSTKEATRLSYSMCKWNTASVAAVYRKQARDRPSHDQATRILLSAERKQ